MGEVLELNEHLRTVRRRQAFQPNNRRASNSGQDAIDHFGKTSSLLRAGQRSTQSVVRCPLSVVRCRSVVRWPLSVVRWPRFEVRIVDLMRTTFNPDAKTRTARQALGVSRPKELLLRPGKSSRALKANSTTKSASSLDRAGSARSSSPRVWDAQDDVPQEVCIKVSEHQETWLREAYFGLALNDHPRAIRVYDRFPLTTIDPPLLYSSCSSARRMET